MITTAFGLHAKPRRGQSSNTAACQFDEISSRHALGVPAKRVHSAESIRHPCAYIRRPMRVRQRDTEHKQLGGRRLDLGRPCESLTARLRRPRRQTERSESSRQLSISRATGRGSSRSRLAAIANFKLLFSFALDSHYLPRHPTRAHLARSRPVQHRSDQAVLDRALASLSFDQPHLHTPAQHDLASSGRVELRVRAEQGRPSALQSDRV